MEPKMIDVHFDFTADPPDFWDYFWENNNGLGAGSYDPDSVSKTLQRYHQILWSKPLPSGETMELIAGDGPKYLTWNEFRFGSDSIFASFRYQRYRPMLERVKQALPDYKGFVENYLHKAYTIGGSIIFPKHQGSINQVRGTNPYIRDRWDLTLECIRLFYEGKDSPLYSTLKKDKAFFNLFVDFKGFVDFFCLQDCVSEDYSAVNLWLGDGKFTDDPLPKTVEEYLKWIENGLQFVERRNARIKRSFSSSEANEYE